MLQLYLVNCTRQIFLTSFPSLPKKIKENRILIYTYLVSYIKRERSLFVHPSPYGSSIYYEKLVIRSMDVHKDLMFGEFDYI